MTPPPIDVVIAAHNEAALLDVCLAALRGQDYPSALVRVFVCDDRSTDATAAIAVRGGATLVSAPSPGPAAGRNAGIGAGRAPLIAFVDAHAIPAPNWLSALKRAFDDPQVGGCQSRLVSRGTDPRVDRFVREAEAYSERGLTERTVAGARTLYPWLLACHRMQRNALEGVVSSTSAGEERGPRRWRVVLAGYLLAATGDTEVSFQCRWRP